MAMRTVTSQVMGALATPARSWVLAFWPKTSSFTQGSHSQTQTLLFGRADGATAELRVVQAMSSWSCGSRVETRAVPVLCGLKQAIAHPTQRHIKARTANPGGNSGFTLRTSAGQAGGKGPGSSSCPE
ncbi:hypothetical protein TREES_T100020671 [Tupaia chinensis]|uniref:Uncharacterized protein n=1 Tax=Tupaia chinensis TaxID=246437 RepID=L9KKQ9_TUPCH|nr:hypothetical protein TREES_T100020671 [Tupaia chinensis]